MGDDDGGGELLEALLQNPRLARVPRVTLTDFTNAVFEASMSDGGEEGAGLLHGVEWQHVVLDGEVIPQVLLPEVLPPLSKEGGQAGGAWGNPRRVAVLAGTTTTSAHFTNAEALQVLLANQGRVEVRPAPPPEWLRLAQREQVCDVPPARVCRCVVAPAPPAPTHPTQCCTGFELRVRRGRHR